MYAFISGILEEKGNNFVVINANGVGYEIGVSSNTIDNLPAEGSEVKIYTYLAVREDAMQLYGFLTRDEKQLFLDLITVSGVGPKMAITILSGINVHDLSVALYNKDVSLISKIKGVGKKTAERIVLELSNSGVALNLFNYETMSTAPKTSTSVDEAVMALVDMGLTKFDATNLVRKVMSPNDTTEEIIAKSLRNMG